MHKKRLSFWFFSNGILIILSSFFINYQYTLSQKELVTKTEDCISEKVTKTQKSIQLIKEIVKSPFVEDIKKQWGELFVEKLEMSLQTFIPEIKEELIEESKLTQRYAEIFASAKIEFDGETYNLSSLEPKVLSTDRSTRKRAQQTRLGFIGSHAEELDSLYQDLVKTRTSAAKKLGFKSYTELAYKELGRTEYNPEMIAGFRDQISRVVVPLVHEFKKDQSIRIK